MPWDEGDVRRLLRLAEELHRMPPNPAGRRRRAIAGLCAIVGADAGESLTLATSAEGVVPISSVTWRAGRSMSSAATEGPAIDAIVGAWVYRAPVVAAAEVLTGRQRECLNGMLAGQSEKQIATQLRLSPHTVHVYIKALYRAYGVSTKGELMSRFVGNGKE